MCRGAGVWCVVRGVWCVVRGAWRVVRGAWCVCVRGYDVCVLCVVYWTCRGKGWRWGVHERKTTDPPSYSTTSPFLLGWSSVSEKSAEVVAPEK